MALASGLTGIVNHTQTVLKRIWHWTGGQPFLLTGRMLRLCQQVLQNTEVLADDSQEQVELLLSGLLVKRDGLLKVPNQIYQAVFNLDWVSDRLQNLPNCGAMPSKNQ
jgi:hypothetical protein